MLKRAVVNQKSGKVTSTEYPAKLKCFAFNMYFYSPKAYQYLREVFYQALPHKKTILSWLSSTNAEPGFLKESFDAIEHFIASKPSTLIDGYLPCSLISDEISIKKQLDLAPERSDRRCYGTVDLGDSSIEINPDPDYLEEATEILVIMVRFFKSFSLRYVFLTLSFNILVGGSN